MHPFESRARAIRDSVGVGLETLLEDKFRFGPSLADSVSGWLAAPLHMLSALEISSIRKNRQGPESWRKRACAHACSQTCVRPGMRVLVALCYRQTEQLTQACADLQMHRNKSQYKDFVHQVSLRVDLQCANVRPT